MLLAALFGLTFALGGVLKKLGIPGILRTLFVAMAVQYTPLGSAPTQAPLADVFSFLAQLGVLFLLFFIGLTRMPTAEAMIVPILDELAMIRTRVGGFIVGVGVLDDVIEDFLIAFVSASTLVAPQLSTKLVCMRGDQLRQPVSKITQRGENHESG